MVARLRDAARLRRRRDGAGLYGEGKRADNEDIRRPIWALGSAGAVAALPVISRVRHLVIWADNDASGTGLEPQPRNALRAGARPASARSSANTEKKAAIMPTKAFQYEHEDVEIHEPDPPKRYSISAAELALKSFPHIPFVIPGYIAPGLTLLAGKPKIGKSWMALGWAWAVAAGGKAMSAIQAEQGGVLYLALEDNERRLKKRLAQSAWASCRRQASASRPNGRRSAPAASSASSTSFR